MGMMKIICGVDYGIASNRMFEWSLLLEWCSKSAPTHKLQLLCPLFERNQRSNKYGRDFVSHRHFIPTDVDLSINFKIQFVHLSNLHSSAISTLFLSALGHRSAVTFAIGGGGRHGW